MKALLTSVVATAVLIVAAPAIAHHSFAAQYDPDKPVTLKGTVTKVEWTNPHARFYINVKGCRRRDDELEPRAREPELSEARGLVEHVAERRRRGHGRGLARAQRREHGERPRGDVRRRQARVRAFLHGRRLIPMNASRVQHVLAATAAVAALLGSRCRAAHKARRRQPRRPAGGGGALNAAADRRSGRPALHRGCRTASPTSRVSGSAAAPSATFSGGLLPGEEVKLLPEAEKLMKSRMAADDPEARCLPTGVPRVAPYPWRIVQAPASGKPTHLFFLFEGNIHSYRQIFMDGREPSRGPRGDVVRPFDRALGRRHARDRDGRLQRSVLVRLRRPPAHDAVEHHRALHAHGHGHARERHHGHRPRRVREAVHDQVRRARCGPAGT